MEILKEGKDDLFKNSVPMHAQANTRAVTGVSHDSQDNPEYFTAANGVSHVM